MTQVEVFLKKEEILLILSLKKYVAQKMHRDPISFYKTEMLLRIKQL